MKLSPRFWVAASLSIVVGMIGMAYAAAPLYDMFCKVTGYGGTTQTAIVSTAPTPIDRPIEIRFDANIAPGLSLEFKPDERLRTLKLGETGLAFFRVTNTGPRPVEAVATYNVTPHKTGIYFQKLECFCFQPRVFQPGESVELPVVFYVDPELASDRDTYEVQQITLSYTYFEQPKKAALLPGLGAANTAAAGRDVASPRLGAKGDAG